MGRRDRERIERIKAGLENPIARTAIKVASKGAVIRELEKASTEEQIEVLDSISPSKVGKAIMRKAPHEMDKGIRIFKGMSRPITVEGLLEEVRTTPGFLDMCEKAGVPYSWFEELAKEQMIKNGVEVTA